MLSVVLNLVLVALSVSAGLVVAVHYPDVALRADKVWQMVVETVKSVM